jgi:Na+-translocating ferredoxin:NAD+ oxidoreductase RNF subunit RnfB
MIMNLLLAEASESTTQTYLWAALWAFLILLGLGILLAILMVWASKVFHVEEDPRIKDVEAMLPNANCGNCGYPGCHEMAAALVCRRSQEGQPVQGRQCRQELQAYHRLPC